MSATILIVEDEGLIALHISEILANAGFEAPDPVSSGEDALEYIRTSPLPDLILMDIGLSGELNGIETARRIHTHSDIPVIFLTAYSDQNRINEAAEVSRFERIRKPFTEKDLISAVEKALSQTRNKI